MNNGQCDDMRRICERREVRGETGHEVTQPCICSQRDDVSQFAHCITRGDCKMLMETRREGPRNKRIT